MKTGPKYRSARARYALRYSSQQVSGGGGVHSCCEDSPSGQLVVPVEVTGADAASMHGSIAHCPACVIPEPSSPDLESAVQQALATLASLQSWYGILCAPDCSTGKGLPCHEAWHACSLHVSLYPSTIAAAAEHATLDPRAIGQGAALTVSMLHGLPAALGLARASILPVHLCMPALHLGAWGIHCPSSGQMQKPPLPAEVKCRQGWPPAQAGQHQDLRRWGARCCRPASCLQLRSQPLLPTGLLRRCHDDAGGWPATGQIVSQSMS